MFGLQHYVQELVKLAKVPKRLLSMQSRRRNHPSPAMIHGTLIIGYVEASLGIGESTRRLTSSIAGSALKIGLYPYNAGVETRFIGPFMPELYDRQNIYSLNLIEMAIDELPEMFSRLGISRFNQSYNILRTYWELPEAPPAWATALELVDEIWVPSHFVKNSLKRIFDGPINIVPPSIDKIDNEALFERNHFGLKQDKFYFMFSFDYFSSFYRKNPQAVISCFKKAFASTDARVGLVVKCVGASEDYTAIKRHLQEITAEDPRIIILDGQLSHVEMRSLIKQIDCYVSLHRSEGFGLGMVEAMSEGKIVIATDFSGSVDFVTQQTAYPIRYSIVPLKCDDYSHWEGQYWAEADEQAATEAMIEVLENKDEAARRANNARYLVRSRYIDDKVGRIAYRRISCILSYI